MADKKRVRMTVLLDSDTIDTLRAFTLDKTGKESVSLAIRMLAKEYEQKEKRKTIKNT